MSDAEALSFLDRMSNAPLFPSGEWWQLGIAEPVSDSLIGDIGVYLDEDASSAEIGFTLSPKAQGRGLATAAVREAMLVLYAATTVRQVRGITDERNMASVRLLERVGFLWAESRPAVFRGEPCTEKVYIHRRSSD